ncbi:MAG: rhodanese-like domain-containing protein [Cytophaga sp.]|uniref:rhodanese-like domain-containing protein n=1 Tax=Cytophaga sp. TaxID=29535 RepID=UPI003F803819
MKKSLHAVLLLSTIIIAVAFSYPAEKLIEPAQLAAVLQNPAAKKPAIYNVGPMAMIPDAVLIGETINPANQTKIKTALKDVPRDKEIVIYCGCCKIEDCWNIHEASTILTNMGFTNFKILNIKTDFKTDWSDKKYPVK